MISCCVLILDVTKYDNKSNFLNYFVHDCVNRFFEKIEGGLQVLGYCGFGLGVS